MAGLRLGPYTMTYLGRVATNASTSVVNASFNLGEDYYDRLVFIGFSRTGGSVSSVLINSSPASVIGEYYTYGTSEYWMAKLVPGTTNHTIQANLAGAYSTTMFVYVLGGGAGLNPTFNVRAVAGANDNNISLTYPTVLANDFILCIGCKLNGGTSVFDGFSSSAGPMVNTINSVAIGTDNSSCGVGYVGPVSTGAGTNVTVNAHGSDSSKNLNMLCVRFSKAP